MKLKIPGIITRYWLLLKKPVPIALGLILLFGFTAGVIFWGGFNTTMAVSNTEQFCISCHEMRNNVYEEYKDSIHYSNRSGVRASCPDCHVPKEWSDKIVRKVQASKELWGKLLGTIGTPEKFAAHRLTMAKREWKRLKDNDSLECRNCHNFDYMDISEQRTLAARMHTTALASGDKTCIDCHKGIAHKLPNMKNIEGWQ